MKIKARNAAPIMILTVFLLTLISRSLDLEAVAGGVNPYLTVCVVQIIAVLLPAAIFCKLRGTGYISRLRLRRPSAEQLIFMLFMMIALASGGTLIMLLAAQTEPGSWPISGGDSNPGTAVAFAVLPAFCEEFTFRSVFCAEYEEYGSVCAALTSSVLFAMLHFDLTLFPLYFFCGILLSLTLFATRSVLCPIILHMLFNLYVLIGAPLLPEFLSGAESDLMLIFLLCVIFMLSLALAMGEAGRLYRTYARRYPSGEGDGDDRGAKRRIPRQGFAARFASGAFSPAVLVCALFFVIIIIGR